MNNRNEYGFSFSLFYPLIIILVFVLVMGFMDRMNLGQVERYTYQQFEEAVTEGKVASAILDQSQEVPTGSVTITLKTGSRVIINVTDVGDAAAFLGDNEVPYVINAVPEESVFLTIILPILIGLGLMIFLVVFMVNRAAGAAGGQNQMMNFGRSRARMIKNSGKDFSKVAGLQEEKEDLAEVVDFLKNPNKYAQLGARIPKGVLLVGPPGTGKTLLAKAVAGEAGVPFFYISGSDFVEMFVGVGASRVRDMFADAKENSPCIVFIDEIDAVARRRGTGMGGGHDEREQTLNQLLVEMDGFSPNQGIIVMAATNRVDILDPAIMRPGRFDRKVTVGRPDVKGREAILRVHASARG